jgi:hypothetical protein
VPELLASLPAPSLNQRDRKCIKKIPVNQMLELGLEHSDSYTSVYRNIEILSGSGVANGDDRQDREPRPQPRVS